MATTIEDALSAPIPAGPNAAEFDGIRADLARLFIRYKTDLGMADYPNSFIVDNVNRIAGAIMACGTIAIDRGDTEWLGRHRWFSDAAARLFDNGLGGAAGRVVAGAMGGLRRSRYTRWAEESGPGF